MMQYKHQIIMPFNYEKLEGAFGEYTESLFMSLVFATLSNDDSCLIDMFNTIVDDLGYTTLDEEMATRKASEMYDLMCDHYDVVGHYASFNKDILLNACEFEVRAFPLEATLISVNI